VRRPRLAEWQLALPLALAYAAFFLVPLVLLIAVSGYVKDEDRRRSQSAGFDHHLGKPADPGKLLGLLRMAG